MTPQQVIDAVRVVISDDNPLMPERFSDTDLLGFVNQAVKRIAVVRPDLFITVEDITPTVDNVSQTLDSTITRLMEIHRVVDGGALGEVDKETMDRSAPDWPTETSGTPVNWMRHPRNPRRYFLYPAPATGTQLTVEYIKVPSDYGVSDTIALPDSYKAIMIDLTVALAEGVDNEHVENERAKSYYESAMQALGADMAQRSVVDNENGMPPEQRNQRRG